MTYHIRVFDVTDSRGRVLINAVCGIQNFILFTVVIVTLVDRGNKNIEEKMTHYAPEA